MIAAAQYPTTLLGTMLADRNAALRAGAERVYFFDRNQDAFAAILDWYRTSLLVAPPSVPLALFLLEVDFWQIPVRRDEVAHDSSLGQRLHVMSAPVGKRGVVHSHVPWAP